MALDEEDDFLAALPGEEETDVAVSDDESDPGEDAILLHNQVKAIRCLMYVVDVAVELESDEQEQIMRRSLEPRISSGSERRSVDSGSAAPEEVDMVE